MVKFTYKFKFTCQTKNEEGVVGDYVLYESEKRLSPEELTDVWHNRLFEDSQGHYFNVHSIKFASLEEHAISVINLKLADLR